MGERSIPANLEIVDDPMKSAGLLCDDVTDTISLFDALFHNSINTKNIFACTGLACVFFLFSRETYRYGAIENIKTFLFSERAPRIGRSIVWTTTDSLYPI